MSKLHQYLQQNIRNVFWFWELNHVLGFTYNAILRAAQAEADCIEIQPYQITWFNGKVKIDKQELNTETWNSDYLSCFNKIRKRDKIVKQVINVIHDSKTKVVCEFLHDTSK